jgi:hypothetical protein
MVDKELQHRVTMIFTLIDPQVGRCGRAVVEKTGKGSISPVIGDVRIRQERHLPESLVSRKLLREPSPVSAGAAHPETQNIGPVSLGMKSISKRGSWFMLHVASGFLSFCST